MARARLTVDEIILSVEKHLKQIARRTHSDELILQLIRSKTANQFTEEDIKNLRNKYHKVLELNRLEELMDSICTIKKVIALILKMISLILVDMKTFLSD
jgi:hypothetical protein